MFSDANLTEPNLIIEIESPVRLTPIDEKDGLFFNDKFTPERRVRTYVYNMLLKAKENLPPDYFFVVYEAYRPLDAQKKLWDEIVKKNKEKHPEMDISSEEFIAMCNVFVANPYRQGSGHQSGASIDVSLVNSKGEEYDMGGTVRGFEDTAYIAAPGLSKEAEKNREILRSSMEKAGFVNYPSEWWHYSFGDRLWAKLTGSQIAIFAKLDI